MNSFCSDTTRHDFARSQPPTQAAHRGAYRLPHMSQELGRDLAGESYAGGRGSYGVIQTTPEWRTRMSCPYLWLVQTAEIQAHTAFLNAEGLLDWCSAYAVTLTGALHRSYQTFSAEIGDPAHWLPLTVRDPSPDELVLYTMGGLGSLVCGADVVRTRLKTERAARPPITVSDQL